MNLLIDDTIKFDFKGIANRIRIFLEAKLLNNIIVIIVITIISSEIFDTLFKK